MFAQLKTKGYAGAARNFGIDFPIQSEYTWFIDSDDRLASNDVLDKMHKRIVADKFPDALRCSYAYEMLNKTVPVKTVLNVDAIMHDGGAPFKTCIRSSFRQHFIEGRARNNDVVWFMKLMDAVDFKRISAIYDICYIYNYYSINSCQNSPHMKFSKSCIDADRMLVDDLKALTLNKPQV